MNLHDEDKPSDPIDQASNLDLMYTAQNIAKARLGAQAEQLCQDGRWSTYVCVDCEEDIEPERLAHGRIRCFSCQDFKERSAARGRR